MPQKTRKEKIAAVQRKSHTYTFVETPQKNVLPDKKELEKKKTAPVYSDEDSHIYQYFRKDLKKSISLVGGILLLEYILYAAKVHEVFFR